MRDLRMFLESETNPYFLDIKIKTVTRVDQFYSVNGGAYGKWNIGLSYDNIPITLTRAR